MGIPFLTDADKAKKDYTYYRFEELMAKEPIDFRVPKFMDKYIDHINATGKNPFTGLDVSDDVKVMAEHYYTVKGLSELGATLAGGVIDYSEMTSGLQSSKINSGFDDVFLKKQSDYSVEQFKIDMEELPHIDLHSKITDGLISTPNGKRPSVHYVYSQEEINNHLAMFQDGIVKVIGRERYVSDLEKYGSTIGPPSGQFVMPKFVYDKAVKASNGNPRILEQLLTLEAGSLGTNPIAIISDNFKGLRMPSGNEPGAWQGEWIPSGYTKGGIPEAIIDPLSDTQYVIKNVYGGE